MRALAWLFLVAAGIGLSATARAESLYTPEVRVGSYAKDGLFNGRGYGILVRYAEQCLVVTLNHVAKNGVDDTMFDTVAIESLDYQRAARADYVDNRQRTDIYVGRIPADSMFEADCRSAATLEELEGVYRQKMDQMLSVDFQKLTLHKRPTAISLAPESHRTLEEAKRGEPIRYTVDDCGIAACDLPTQQLSGSVVSVKGNGDRFLLGLHQGRCDDYCASSELIWEAVSIVTIYEHFKADRFPLNSKVAAMPKEKPGEVGPRDFTLDIQKELKRLNCEPGDLDGKWGTRSSEALKRFSRAYGMEVSGKRLGQDTLSLLQEPTPAECPPICGAGFTLKDGACKRTARAKTPDKTASSTSNKPPKRRTNTPPARRTTSEGGGNCITVNGMIACP